MFRFTIRDVLWLTVVAAMGAGWWIHRHDADARLKAQRDLFFAKLQAQERKSGSWEGHAHNLARTLRGVGIKVELSQNELSVDTTGYRGTIAVQ